MRHGLAEQVVRISVPFPQRVPANGPQGVTDVFTRWDSPTKLWSLMPPNTEWIEVRGLRVLTPFAAAHRIPFFGTSLRKAEQVASRSALRYFGGFFVLVLRKS